MDVSNEKFRLVSFRIVGEVNLNRICSDEWFIVGDLGLEAT